MAEDDKMKTWRLSKRKFGQISKNGLDEQNHGVVLYEDGLCKCTSGDLNRIKLKWIGEQDRNKIHFNCKKPDCGYRTRFLSDFQWHLVESHDDGCYHFKVGCTLNCGQEFDNTEEAKRKHQTVQNCKSMQYQLQQDQELESEQEDHGRSGFITSLAPPEIQDQMFEAEILNINLISDIPKSHEFPQHKLLNHLRNDLSFQNVYVSWDQMTQGVQEVIFSMVKNHFPPSHSENFEKYKAKGNKYWVSYDAKSTRGKTKGFLISKRNDIATPPVRKYSYSGWNDALVDQFQIIKLMGTRTGHLRSGVATFLIRKSLETYPYALVNADSNSLRVFRYQGFGYCFSEMARERLEDQSEVIKLIKVPNGPGKCLMLDDWQRLLYQFIGLQPIKIIGCSGKTQKKTTGGGYLRSNQVYFVLWQGWNRWFSWKMIQPENQGVTLMNLCHDYDDKRTSCDMENTTYVEKPEEPRGEDDNVSIISNALSNSIESSATPKETAIFQQMRLESAQSLLNKGMFKYPFERGCNMGCHWGKEKDHELKTCNSCREFQIHLSCIEGDEASRDMNKFIWLCEPCSKQIFMNEQHSYQDPDPAAIQAFQEKWLEVKEQGCDYSFEYNIQCFKEWLTKMGLALSPALNFGDLDQEEGFPVFSDLWTIFSSKDGRSVEDLRKLVLDHYRKNPQKYQHPVEYKDSGFYLQDIHVGRAKDSMQILNLLSEVTHRNILLVKHDGLLHFCHKYPLAQYKKSIMVCMKIKGSLLFGLCNRHWQSKMSKLTHFQHVSKGFFRKFDLEDEYFLERKQAVRKALVRTQATKIFLTRNGENEEL